MSFVENVGTRVSKRLSNTAPVIREFKLPTLRPAWVRVNFVCIDNIKFNRICLSYKLTGSHEEELWDTRSEWKDALESYLDRKLSRQSFGTLRIRSITVTKGSLFFGIDIAILGGIAAILGIINGLISLGKHIADFFRNRNIGFA